MKAGGAAGAGGAAAGAAAAATSGFGAGARCREGADGMGTEMGEVAGFTAGAVRGAGAMEDAMLAPRGGARLLEATTPGGTELLWEALGGGGALAEGERGRWGVDAEEGVAGTALPGEETVGGAPEGGGRVPTGGRPPLSEELKLLMVEAGSSMDCSMAACSLRRSSSCSKSSFCMRMSFSWRGSERIMVGGADAGAAPAVTDRWEGVGLGGDPEEGKLEAGPGESPSAAMAKT